MRRFDIDLFIKKAMNLNLLELLELSQKEANEIEKIRITPKSTLKQYEWEIKQFAEFLSGLNCILMTGIKPFSMEKTDLQKLRPVFQKFVENGQWQIEGMKIFD